MRSGKLRKRVSVYAPTFSQNGFGEIEVVYSAIFTAWADVSQLGSREFFAAKQVQAEDSIKVTIRKPSQDITHEHTALIDGVSYNITGLINSFHGDEFITMLCRKNYAK